MRWPRLIAADVVEVPRTELVIVPGAGVNPDGTMSTMLADRVEQALRLRRAGKVEKVLAIATADGRESWGPEPPAGTPPTASPGR